MTDIPSRLTAALSDRYRIERQLGEGGMATVYLADDRKHDRKVALKVLKPELAAVVGADRFLSEIKTTAQLQHPHILPLFDSGESDGLLWYAMPYVEGESLRDRLDRERQLPVSDAIAIAAKVAGALQAAHERGIVHRDIKPANILLMKGEPLVSDFGIALAVQEAGGGRLTETGLSVGTPFYMSPEQATADRPPDARADVYSLGCMLYEMLVGEPPFTGSSAQAILGRILTQQPSLVTEERASVPRHVARTIDRALQKLPADRFATAAEFARALSDPAATEAWGASPATPSAADEDGRSRVGRWVWPAVAGLMTVLAAVGWLHERGDEPERAVTRLVLPMPDETGISSGVPLFLNVSRDGRSVLYLRESSSGGSAVFLRDLASVDARMVFTAQAFDGTFSPEGDRIVIQDGANLHLVSREGGSPTLLTSDVLSLSPVRWASDGWIYYTSADDVLARIRPDSREAETIPVADSVGTLFMVHPLPEFGAGIVWSLMDQSIGYLRFDSGSYTRLYPGQYAWVVNHRYLVWFDDGNLRGQRFDPASGTGNGPVVDLLDGEAVTLAIGSPLVSVAESGTLVYVPGEREVEDNLVSISRDGGRTALGITVESDLGLTLSPRGDQVAFEERPTTRGDIYVADLDTGLRTRLTFDADAVYPTYTPDGERVAYYRYIDGDYGLYWRPADGSGVEEVLLDGPGREIEVRFFPDRERILVRQGDRSTVDGTDIFVYRVGDPDSGRPIADGPGNEVAPRLSPDGRYVAYATDELGGVQHVFVRSIEDPRERWQITDVRGGNQPLWSPDGSELYYRRASALMAAPVRTEPAFRRLGEPVELFQTIGLVSNTNHTAYDIFPDGENFLFIEAPQGTEAQIVIDWMVELEDRLGR